MQLPWSGIMAWTNAYDASRTAAGCLVRYGLASMAELSGS